MTTDSKWKLHVEPSIPYRQITSSVNKSIKKYISIIPGKSLPSDKVVRFLESRSPIYEFEYAHISREGVKMSLGYEIKTVDEINAIYLMINPDPRNLAEVPSNSLVISHHKISCYDNPIYRGMLKLAEDNHFNIFNFHLAWDVMESGIGDSFLYHVGLARTDFTKVDLTYKEHRIRNLGAIVKKEYDIGDLITRLHALNVEPSVIVNPQCRNPTIGYIPGGGFTDQMIMEMAEYGVGILVSSDHNWVVETIARELEITLVDINHYASERYGLQTMQNLLSTAFPSTPTTILENVDDVECDLFDCNCSSVEFTGDCN
ncbi:MAG: Nif3-like dinuclear metal center hexameric protein [Candidatus Heimdallarchaeota archaeon]